MENLIRALQIFLKYKNERWPTQCEHDVLYIVGIEPKSISEADKIELESLGFIITDDEIYSYRYGSA